MNETIRNKVKLFLEILEEFPEFRYLGDPILRSPTEKVMFIEGKEIGEKLGKILVSYRKKAGIGRGLAAPQLGMSKKVFVTFLNDTVQIYINPKITKRSQKSNFYRELCLSSGIMWADVKRSEAITMEWTDEDGKPQKRDFDGLEARLLQHEEAHLRGKVNLDEAVNGTIEIVAKDPLKEKIREELNS